MWSGTDAQPKPSCLRHKLVCRGRHYCLQTGVFCSLLVKLPLIRELNFPLRFIHRGREGSFWHQCLVSDFGQYLKFITKYLFSAIEFLNTNTNESDIQPSSQQNRNLVTWECYRPWPCYVSLPLLCGRFSGIKRKLHLRQILSLFPL